MRLIATLAAEAPALPPEAKNQLANGFQRCLDDLVSALGAGEREELATIVLSCWLGTTIRRKADATAAAEDVVLHTLMDQIAR